MFIRSFITILIGMSFLSIQAQNMSLGLGASKFNADVSCESGTGSINDAIAIKAGMRLYKNNNWAIALNGRYFSADYDISDYDKKGTYDSDKLGIDSRHSWGQFGTTITYSHNLAGKPFIGMAMINSDWGTGGFERISETFMGLLMLRTNRQTQVGVGSIILLNRGVKLPIFPVIMYRHDFSSQMAL